ncbi:MAG: AsmA family protein [Bryobacteraceae bacterium]|nr:AsmA family protein [Bryobacteraceae bacterium]
MKPRGALRRRIKVLAPAVVAICLAAPLVRADRYRDRIRRALQQALDRKVEISGAVRLKLFPQPGLSISRVIIHDDPSFGLEPLAYVPTLDIGVRLSSLFQRRLEFSRLSLNDPKVNLVKSDEGAWNYPPLLDRAFDVSRRGRARLPEIRVRSGRLNFKFGLTKSIFYFANTDLDVSPSRAEPTGVQLRFSGEPARTDRPGGRFSTLTGAGLLTFPPDGGNRIAVSLHLERSPLSEVLRLLHGRGMGLAGFIASTARLEGEMSAIRITGSLQMVEFDQRLLLRDQASTSSIDYRGLLDLQAQRLTLESGTGQLPVSIRFHASDYLTQVRWALAVALRELPLDSLPELARETGTAVPPGLALGGSMSGAFSLSSQGRLRGQLAIQDANISVPDAGRLSVQEASLFLDDRMVRLKPAAVRAGEEDAARVEVSYAPPTGELDVSLDAERVSIPAFVAFWQRLASAPPAPLFSSFLSGVVQGQLRYRTGSGSGAWSGKFTIKEAVIPVEGLNKPVSIASAAATLRPTSTQIRLIRASAGDIGFSGNYRAATQPAQPHRIDLHIPRADAVELERLLQPSLVRPRQGFIARTLRFPPPTAPKWLRNRFAEGAVHVDELTAGPVRLRGAGAKLRWRGLSAEFENLTSECHEGLLSGHITVDLRNATPRYKAELDLKGVAWESGVLNVAGILEASGLGDQVLAGLRADGSFSGHWPSPAPPNMWDSAFGSFELTTAGGLPVLALKSLEVARGADTYSGTGRTAGGNLELVLSNDNEQLGMTGTLIPLRLQPRSKGIR